jgi:hypothetical protein
MFYTFYLLESNIAKFGFTPGNIFNVDESGFSTMQKRPQEIVAAVLLPADTAKPSSSETQNPHTSLGTESDSENSNDSGRDEDYKPSGKRMKHFERTLQQISPLQNGQLIHDQQCHEEAMEERKRQLC